MGRGLPYSRLSRSLLRFSVARRRGHHRSGRRELVGARRGKERPRHAERRGFSQFPRGHSETACPVYSRMRSQAERAQRRFRFQSRTAPLYHKRLFQCGGGVHVDSAAATCGGERVVCRLWPRSIAMWAPRGKGNGERGRKRAPRESEQAAYGAWRQDRGAPGRHG